MSWSLLAGGTPSLSSARQQGITSRAIALHFVDVLWGVTPPPCASPRNWEVVERTGAHQVDRVDLTTTVLGVFTAAHRRRSGFPHSGSWQAVSVDRNALQRMQSPHSTLSKPTPVLTERMRVRVLFTEANI